MTRLLVAILALIGVACTVQELVLMKPTTVMPPAPAPCKTAIP